MPSSRLHCSDPGAAYHGTTDERSTAFGLACPHQPTAPVHIPLPKIRVSEVSTSRTQPIISLGADSDKTNLVGLVYPEHHEI
jgi:hypothetical protein